MNGDDEAVCACGRRWRVAGTHLDLVGVSPPAPEPAAEALVARRPECLEKPAPESSDGLLSSPREELAIREIVESAGYRSEAPVTLEIRHLHSHPLPPLPSERASRVRLVGAFGLATVLAFLLLGAVWLVSVGGWLGLLAGIVVVGATIAVLVHEWRRPVVAPTPRDEEPKWLPLHREVRVGPRLVEVRVEDGWRTLARTASVDGVDRRAGREGAQLRLEAAGEQVVLLHRLREDHADEVESRLRRHLERLRA